MGQSELKRGIAKQHDIPFEFEIQKVKPGWDGAPKGMLQILFETGWIDPKKLREYRCKPPAAWKDDEGKIKPEFRHLVLTHLLANRKDFAEEVTALEYIANKLSTEDATVRVVFSPKYHCEIAGEGIEMCWGFLKKFYRRKFTLDEKKHKFSQCIDLALRAVPSDTVRKYAGHVYGYMMAYKRIERDGDPVSYKIIEQFMKKYKGHRCTMDQESAIINSDVQRALGRNQ